MSSTLAVFSSFPGLRSVSLSLLHLLLHFHHSSAYVPIRRYPLHVLRIVSTHQSLHRAVQRMPMIPSEFRIRAFEGGVAMGFRLLDTVARNVVSAERLPICLEREALVRKQVLTIIRWRVDRTRCGEPSCSGYAETNSSILHRPQSAEQPISQCGSLHTSHCDCCCMTEFVRCLLYNVRQFSARVALVIRSRDPHLSYLISYQNPNLLDSPLLRCMFR